MTTAPDPRHEARARRRAGGAAARSPWPCAHVGLRSAVLPGGGQLQRAVLWDSAHARYLSGHNRRDGRQSPAWALEVGAPWCRAQEKPPALPGSWAQGLPMRPGAGTVGQRRVPVTAGLLCPQTSASPRSVGSSFVFVFVRAQLCPWLGCIGLGFLPVCWPGTCSRPLVPLWAEAPSSPCGMRPSRHSAARAPGCVPHPHASLSCL